MMTELKPIFLVGTVIMIAIIAFFIIAHRNGTAIQKYMTIVFGGAIIFVWYLTCNGGSLT